MYLSRTLSSSVKNKRKKKKLESILKDSIYYTGYVFLRFKARSAAVISIIFIVIPVWQPQLVARLCSGQ